MRFRLQRVENWPPDLEMASAKASPQAHVPRPLFKRACAAFSAVFTVLFLWSAVGLLIVASSVRLGGIYVDLVPGSDGAPETLNVTFKAQTTQPLPFGHELRISSAQCAVAIEADAQPSTEAVLNAALVRAHPPRAA